VPYLGKVWYDGYDRTLTMVLPDGLRVTVPQVDPPTDSAAFDVVQREMESREMIRHARIGDAQSLLYTASDAIEVALELLRSDWKVLLCHHPRCPVCTKARSLS
jgi:aminoglycoside N3'-acetyltransferase